MATASAVFVIDNYLDGGKFWRCGGCRHPYRMAEGRDHGPCGVCGHPRKDSEPCDRATYRASRADDAPVPFTAD
jgi:hypothetical protein